MKIWHLNPTTNEYLEPGLADESPLEPGVYLIPAHATTVEPPPVNDREAAICVDGVASVVPDWRGYRYWLPDGSRHAIHELGIVPPGEATEFAPLVALAMRPVSRAQGKIALHRAGLLERVESVVASDDCSEELRIAWHDAAEWRRDSPALAAIAQILALDDADIDALFVEAARVTI